MRREMTPAERRLWRALRDRQLGGYKFRRQHPVGTFVLDFSCPEAKLAVEVDGTVHNDRDQTLKDAARTEVLNNFGITVLRIPNTVVFLSLTTALHRIRQPLMNSPEP